MVNLFAGTKEATAPAPAVEQPPYPCATPLTLLDLSSSNAKLSQSAVGCVEGLLDATFEAVQDLLLPSPHALQSMPSCQGDCYTWRPVNFHDSHEKSNQKVVAALGGTLFPSGNSPFSRRIADEKSLNLFTMQHINGYHMTKAHMFFTGVTPEEFLTHVHCNCREKRRRFTPSMRNYVRWFSNPNLTPAAAAAESACHTREELENAQLPVLAAMKSKARGSASAYRHWYLESNVFSAPPPVSCREALMAVEKLYSPTDDCYYIYGCSLDTNEHPSVYAERASQAASTSQSQGMAASDYGRCVRATYMFCWKLEPCRDPAASVILSTRATMLSVMNPGGWTPTFILSWFKSEIGKEVAFMRKSLYSIVLERRRERAAVGMSVSVSAVATASAAATRLRRTLPAIIANTPHATSEAADPQSSKDVRSGNGSPTVSAFLSDDGANTEIVTEEGEGEGDSSWYLGGCSNGPTSALMMRVVTGSYSEAGDHGWDRAVADEDEDGVDDGSYSDDDDAMSCYEPQQEDVRLVIGLEDEEHINLL